MRYYYVLLFLIVTGGCHTKKPANNKPMEKPAKKVVLQDVHITETEEGVEPPPEKLTTEFENVQAWLTSICHDKPPMVAIATYEVGVFETPGDGSYVLFLIGTNTRDEGSNSTKNIAYKPAHPYYLLPANEYKHLNRAQVFNRLTTQLKDFTATATFKNSFLAKAQALKCNFGGVIWSR